MNEIYLLFIHIQLSVFQNIIKKLRETKKCYWRLLSLLVEQTAKTIDKRCKEKFTFSSTKPLISTDEISVQNINNFIK